MAKCGVASRRASEELIAQGRVMVNNTNAAAMIICIASVHHLLVLKISTNGLQNGLIIHGRYSKLVKNAISPFGTPIFVNIITEMVLTRK